MSDVIDKSVEEVHEHAEHGDGWARGVAVLVSILGAALAMTGIAEKASQNDYLAAHIQASDDWSFYQAKNQRMAIRASEVTILQSLPTASDPAVQARIKAAQDYIAHARDDPDGTKSLADQAHEREHLRDHALHRYHGYEYASGALELAIVLASVSVVIRNRPLTFGAGLLGLGGMLLSLAVRFGLY